MTKLDGVEIVQWLRIDSSARHTAQDCMRLRRSAADELERLSTEGTVMRKALEDIEQMEPGLLDGDSSCDMSAAVASMALAAVVKQSGE